eukprot:2228820-Amphidinium_carterae.1
MEQERGTLIKVLGERHADGATSIVDAKGIGQPFKYNGKKEHDFAEWTHKTKVFLVARFGDKIMRPLQWAARQRRTVASTNESGSSRVVAWLPEFGPDALEEEDRLPNAERVIVQVYTYLVSFTTGDANRVVRNAGEGQGLEAWRRLTNEYDPTSSMRRVSILGM